MRTELSKLNMDQTFLKILARKYNLKYPNKYSETGPNTTPTLQDTGPAVKIKRLILQNGDNITEKADNFILTCALEDKHAIFEMFNINMATLESKLTGLFKPMTELLCMLDKNFQGSIQNESNIDFLLRLLIRLSEIFGSKTGNEGTLIRCPYYFASDTFNIKVAWNVFIIKTKHKLAIPGYSMRKFDFNLLLLINEVLDYQKKLRSTN